MNSAFVLKVGPIEFTDSLGVEYEKKIEIKDISKAFDLSNLKAGIAIN